MTKTSKNSSFEQALAKLEKMVEKLEEGSLPLADSLKTFEEGMALVQFCEKKLSEAEGKVEMLTKASKDSKEE